MSKQPDPNAELRPFSVEEGVYLTRLTKKFRERDAWERPKPGEVLSFIPGKVLQIFANDGQRLAAGESLLTFEAMKMENTFTMPCDGVVKQVHVKVGDVFPKNRVLVEIEPD
jgi:biotin carboxyl carrier protein